MKVQARYVAAKLAETKARVALQDANCTDDIEAQAHAFANVICAEQKCSNAFDERSQRQLHGASSLASEAREHEEVKPATPASRRKLHEGTIAPRAKPAEKRRRTVAAR